MRTRRLALILIAVTATFACNEVPVRDLTSSYQVQVQEIRDKGKPAKLDILWVIDDSPSMCQEQQSLARSFSKFLEVFQRYTAIDMQLAVTTTNVCPKAQDKNAARGRFVYQPATEFPLPCRETRVRACSRDEDCQADASLPDAKNWICDFSTSGSGGLQDLYTCDLPPQVQQSSGATDKYPGDVLFTLKSTCHYKCGPTCKTDADCGEGGHCLDGSCDPTQCARVFGPPNSCLADAKGGMCSGGSCSADACQNAPDLTVVSDCANLCRGKECQEVCLGITGNDAGCQAQCGAAGATCLSVCGSAVKAPNCANVCRSDWDCVQTCTSYLHDEGKCQQVCAAGSPLACEQTCLDSGHFPKQDFLCFLACENMKECPERCMAEFGDPEYRCINPGSGTSSTGCILPPPTSYCPKTFANPPILNTQVADGYAKDWIVKWNSGAGKPDWGNPDWATLNPSWKTLPIDGAATDRLDSPNPAGQCVLSGVCTRDADCQAGFQCKANQCVAAAACKNDSECSAGSKCLDSQCVCTQDSDCASPAKCVTERVRAQHWIDREPLRLRIFDQLFRCMATVGAQQTLCGNQEQGLRAAFAALDPNGENKEQAKSFLRDGAYLLIVAVSDEDDCSAYADSIVDPKDGKTKAAVIPEDFQWCSCLYDENGCSPADVLDRSKCDYNRCLTNGKFDPQLCPLRSPITVANQLKSLKPDPSQVLFAAIAASPVPDEGASAKGASVAQLRSRYFDCKCDRKAPRTAPYVYGCQSSSGTGDLGVRYLAVADQFGLAGDTTSDQPQFGQFANICSEAGLEPSLESIAKTVVPILTEVCLPRPLESTCVQKCQKDFQEPDVQKCTDICSARSCVDECSKFFPAPACKKVCAAGEYIDVFKYNGKGICYTLDAGGTCLPLVLGADYKLVQGSPNCPQFDANAGHRIENAIRFTEPLEFLDKLQIVYRSEPFYGKGAGTVTDCGAAGCGD